MTSLLLLLAFMLSICSLLSLWIHKTFWLWVPPLGLSLICMYTSGHLTIMAFIPLGILILTLIGLRWNATGLYRFILVALTLIISGGLFYHMLPGFGPLISFVGNSVNYEKLIAALLLLGFLVPIISTKSSWIVFSKTSLPFALIGSLGIIFLSLSIKPQLWHTKNLTGLLIGSLIHFIMTILPEEALVRGFIQKEFFQWIGGGIKGHVCAVVLSSCLYALLHVVWITDLSLLGILLLSNLIYGFLYQITRQIEGPLLCHFLTDFFLTGSLPFNI